MNKIIPILKKTIGTKEINSVNAKEIYDYLKVKTAYTTWIQRTVDKYGFIGGEDFFPTLKSEDSGQTSTKYIVTMDMALSLLLESKNIKAKREITSSLLLGVKIDAIMQMIKNFDTEELDDVMFLYVVSDSVGNYKVGVSKHPEERVKQLNIGNAMTLKLIHTKKCNDSPYKLEAKVHKNLSACNVRSEWFEGDADNIIDAVEVA